MINLQVKKKQRKREIEKERILIVQKHQSKIKESSTTVLSYQELMVASAGSGTNLNECLFPNLGSDDTEDTEIMY